MRVRLLVAYDGSCFSGFARNDGVVTVAGTLEEHLGDVLGAPVTITCAGRTDKGVHANGQVVSFDAPDGADPARLQRSLNARAAGRVVVREATTVDDDFDARFSARWRRYRYTVVNRPIPDLALFHRSWHVDDELSLAAMRQACLPIIGTHDFACFCRRPKRADGTEASLVRNVLAADWTGHAGDILCFEIRATAFCHQMVRSIVGTLVDVGRGRLTAAAVTGIIAGGDRRNAGQIAPPQGLCLEEVGY